MSKQGRSLSLPACRSFGRGKARAGAVTLELILMLPVWIIVLLAVIEFGLLIANRQQVALASRVGAEEASRTAGLGSMVVFPANVEQAVEQQLASSGITECRIILQHNLPPLGPPPPPPYELSTGACNCPPPSTANLPADRYYVRVTVYVPLTELTPNLLAACGLDLSDRFVSNSTTFRHEL